MKRVILILFLVFGTLQLFCKVSVDSYVKKRKIGLNDFLEYTIEISGEDLKKVNAPGLPHIKNFDNLGSSSSHSSSMQIINGKMTSSVTKSFTYTLRPKNTGKFLIPPIKVKVKNKNYITEAISVEVVRGTTESIPKSRNYKSQKYSNTESDELSDNLFILADVSKKNVYKGEPITVDYKIYTRYDIANLSFQEEPNFNGFWKENIYKAEYKNFERAKYKGQIFNVMRLTSVALFPTSTGKLMIPSIKMTIDVRTQPQSFFDFGSTKRFSVASKSVPINVKEIPFNSPSGFNGAIGDFKIRSSISNTDLKVGDSFTYTLKISGSGNISQFDQPTLPEIIHMRFLDPEITAQINEDKISGSKTIKYLVIAQEQGTFTIPQVPFTFFDTKQGKFVTKKTKPYTINVAEGSNVFVQSSTAQSLVRMEGTDISFIILNDKVQDLRLNFKSLFYWFIWFIVILTIPVSLLVAKERNKLSHDTDYLRQKRAGKILKKYLNEATVAAKDNRIEFYTFAQNGLSNFIADKLNIARGSTFEIILDNLNKQKIDDVMVEMIRVFFDECNKARFMPGGFSKDKIQSDFVSLKNIIGDVSKKV